MVGLASSTAIRHLAHLATNSCQVLIWVCRLVKDLRKWMVFAWFSSEPPRSSSFTLCLSMQERDIAFGTPPSLPAAFFTFVTPMSTEYIFQITRVMTVTHIAILLHSLRVSRSGTPRKPHTLAKRWPLAKSNATQYYFCKTLTIECSTASPRFFPFRWHIL